jgi:uncharacterized protein YndB with AHSA1/START domain
VSQRSVTHATFALERTYPAPPARVFAAWADPADKRRWFMGPEEWGPAEHELDFRVGGREVTRGGPPGGPVHRYEARYYDIVPDERIVHAYEMHLDGTRISVSLATVELTPDGAGTRLIYTEQGAFLDGYDDPAERERGTAELFDALGKELQRERSLA